MSFFTARQRAIAEPVADMTYDTENGDISLLTPDQQFNALANMLRVDDASTPAPNTGTPPFGEPIPYDEYMSDGVLSDAYLPEPDFTIAPDDTELLSVMGDAYGSERPELDWENDEQYHGLGVPPGVPNYDQPVESGHTQIILPNPVDHYREFEWSGKSVARVSRHENGFTRYNAGQDRGHMLDVAQLQNRHSRELSANRSNQARDLLLSEIQRRGVHNVIISDVPQQTYNEQVQQVDPAWYDAQPEIGEAGVLP